MVIASKKDLSIHNLTKIKALIFLSWRKKAGTPIASAKTICQATGANRDSLYVLLSRWYRWRLVGRHINRAPYGYSIAPRGEHYLVSLPNWYEGDLPSIRLDVAIRLRMSFVFPYRRLPFFFRAPFLTVADFNEGSPGSDSLIVVKADNPVEAAKAIFGYGLILAKDCTNAAIKRIQEIKDKDIQL